MADQQITNNASESVVQPAEVIPAVEPLKPLSETVDMQDYRATRRAMRSKGGVQARFDRLTREKRELEAKVNALAPVEAAAKAEAAKAEAAESPATTSEAAPPPISADRVPQASDYTDVNEYHAAIAEHAAAKVARQQVIRRFRGNLEVFTAEHPEILYMDWVDSLKKAAERGLDISPTGQDAIEQLDNGPELAYWLSRPENERSARYLMTMGPAQQAVEVRRMSAWLNRAPAVNPNDFISKAPPPIPRLTSGNTQSTVVAENMPMQDYRTMRRQQRRGNR